MSIFKKAESTQAFVKAGIMGFAGSGKTFTTMQVVFGLKERMDSKAPICFFDTESGSDFFKSACADRGIDLLQVKSRAYVDAVTAYGDALKEGADVLIFDSVTHIWRELCDAYGKQKNRQRLQFQDWQFLKGPDGWQKFTDLFLNAPIHTFISGRAGYEYEYQKDDDGKKELVKTGTKMKVETEFGYEPSLLIEMEREKLSDAKNPNAKGWLHKAIILKDRTNTINGEVFEFTAAQVHGNPRCVFEAVEPHFAKLNIGGAQLGIDVSRSSAELFMPDGEPKAEWARKQKQILIEEVYGLIEAEWPGMDAAAKKRRNDVFSEIAAFAGCKTTKSKTAFEAMGLSAIQKAHVELCLKINEERRANGWAAEQLLSVPDHVFDAAIVRLPEVGDNGSELSF